MRKLHGYQVEMVDHAINRLFIENKRGAGFAADPGLGKTVVALTVARELFNLKEIRRVLITGPIRPLDLVWPKENEEWGFNLSMQRIDAGDTPASMARAMAKNAQIELISRDSLHKLEPFAGRWDLIINDESHGFKNWSSKRTRMMRRIAPKSQRALCMTGTPTPNTLAEFHAQNYILDGGESLGKNVTVFRKRFMVQGGYRGRKWLLREDKKDELMEAIAPIWIRKDAETNLDMPDLVINDVWCELPGHAKRLHAQMKRELAASLTMGDVFAPNAAAGYNKLRQIANGAIYDQEHRTEVIHTAKLQAFIDLVDELNGKQVLVFYQFQFDEAALKGAFKNILFVNGRLKEKEVARNIKRWLEGKDQILAIQNQSGAEGLNLQTGGAADVCFFGIPDQPNLYDQGFRRLYRQGGARAIRVHRFLCEGTIETVQRERLDGKLQSQTDFLNALKEFANG